MIKFTIPGNPRTKKNSPRVFMNGKYPKVLPSKAYCEYEKECGWLIPSKYRNISLESRYNIKVVYYMGTRHKVDLTNLLSATMDILTKYQVIKDDNKDIACSNDGSRVYYDKDNPRCEIEIVDLNNTDEYIKYISNLIRELSTEHEQLFVKRELERNNNPNQIELEI